MSDRKKGRFDAAAGEPAVVEDSVSTVLTRARIALGVELRDVATMLRIRFVFLQAIEDGRFDDLPGAAYATGFLRSYAEYLGLEPEDVIRRYKEEVAGKGRRPELYFPTPVAEGRVPGGTVLLTTLILAGIVYGGWYYLSATDRSVVDLIPALPDRLVSLLGSAPWNSPPPVSDAEARAAAAAAAARLTPPNTVTLATPQAPVPATPATPTSPAAPSAAIPAPPPAATPAPPSTGAPSTGAPSTGAPSTGAPSTGAPPIPPRSPLAAAQPGAAAPAPMAPVPTAPAPNTAVVSVPAVPAFNIQPYGVPGYPSADEEAEGTAQEPTPLAPPVAAAPPPPPPPPAQATPTANGKLYGAVTGPSRIQVRATQDSWLQVRDPKGEFEFTRVLRPGDVFRVPDRPGLRLRTGNAGGLVLVVDGVEGAAMGSVGQVLRDVALDQATTKPPPAR